MVVRDPSAVLNCESRRISGTSARRTGRRATYDVGSVSSANVETVDLSFFKGKRVVPVRPLGDRRERNDTLLGLDSVLLVLMTENALDSLDSGAVVLGQNLLDGLGDVPVLRSGLDGTEGSFGSVVDGSEKVGTDLGDGVGSNHDAGSAKMAEVSFDSGLEAPVLHCCTVATSPQEATALVRRASCNLLSFLPSRKDKRRPRTEDTHVSAATTGYPSM